MATINFLIQTESNPAQIYIRLTNGRAVDVKCKTNLVINPSEWSKSNGQPKNLKNAYYKRLNSQLEQLSIDLLQHFNDKDKDEKINTDWLKRSAGITGLHHPHGLIFN